MVVGTLTVHLHVPESHSLKDKRQAVRSMTARVRQHFNVAVAEVGDLDVWQTSVLGIACVSGDRRHADEICQKVLRFVEDQEGEALITASHFELVDV